MHANKIAAAALGRANGIASVVPDRIERVVPSEWSGDHPRHDPHGDPGHPGHGHGVNPDPAIKLPGLMWDFDRIGAQQAWRTTTGRPSVLVGVADTGLDFTHSELATKVASVVDLTDPTLCTDYFGASDADFAAAYGGPANTDWNGHGSWIGGDIAGALDGIGINGIAPGVGLVALKIAEWCGCAYDSSILAAFYYAADHGIDVVSISFGGYLDRSDPDQDAIYQEYVDAVAYARSKGTVIVAAAGNEHLRIGCGGQVISHGPLTIPGDPFEDYYGIYEIPGGVPGVVDVSATGNVVVGSSATCAPATIHRGRHLQAGQRCPSADRRGQAEPAHLLQQLRSAHRRRRAGRRPQVQPPQRRPRRHGRLAVHHRRRHDRVRDVQHHLELGARDPLLGQPRPAVLSGRVLLDHPGHLDGDAPRLGRGGPHRQLAPVDGAPSRSPRGRPEGDGPEHPRQHDPGPERDRYCRRATAPGSLAPPATATSAGPPSAITTPTEPAWSTRRLPSGSHPSFPNAAWSRPIGPAPRFTAIAWPRRAR